MKYIYTERLVLTKEDVSILNKAGNLLEKIYKQAKRDEDIEDLSRVACCNINDLISIYSEIE